ncbi:hypothetical protein DRQ23_04195 [bacterium]|nr:MAG: hypothetical protein DRQ23_04195 [bacterium]
MKKLFLLSLTLLLLPILLQGAKAGVVEFVERNPVGTPNAGKVVAELLIDKLQKLGKYTLVERVLLFKVLEEQALGMSGVLSTEEAVKVGKIYGLDYVITGSIMKLGKEITITARVTNASTGEIVKTGEAKVNAIEKLPSAAELLAYRLSGYTEREYRALKEAGEKTQKRGGIGFFGGYVMEENQGGMGMGLLIVYYTGRLSIDFSGQTPPSIGQHIIMSIAFNINPTFSIGLSGAYGWASVDPVGDAQFASVMPSLYYRPTSKLRMKLSLGSIVYGTADENGTSIEMAPFSNLNADLWAVYLLSNSMGLLLKITALGGHTVEHGGGYEWSTQFSYGAGIIFYPDFLK